MKLLIDLLLFRGDTLDKLCGVIMWGCILGCLLSYYVFFSTLNTMP